MISSPESVRSNAATDIWSRIAAPLSPEAISWRQDGKVICREGRCAARFVAYTDAGSVRQRLDELVPGEWDLTLTQLPNIDVMGDQGAVKETLIAMKARLQILGVVREDVGQGRDYKAASTDAFKRVAVRFGIAHELYDMGQVWVEMDGDGRGARPIEDPATVFARKQNKKAGVAGSESTSSGVATGRSTPASTSKAAGVANGESSGSGAIPDTPAPAASNGRKLEEESCPKCSGPMYDNRLTKRNPRAPDYKCKDRSCDGVIWPPKPGQEKKQEEEEPVEVLGAPSSWAPLPGSPLIPDDADLPF